MSTKSRLDKLERRSPSYGDYALWMGWSALITENFLKQEPGYPDTYPPAQGGYIEVPKEELERLMEKYGDKLRVIDIWGAVDESEA